jgi:hypothetical protein
LKNQHYILFLANFYRININYLYNRVNGFYIIIYITIFVKIYNSDQV